MKLWFGFFYLLDSYHTASAVNTIMRKEQTRKMAEIKSSKGPVRQVNSSSTIFLTKHQNIWCMDDACFWTSQVVESSGDNTTAFYTPEVSNSENLASCSQEKGLRNFNTALPFHCSIEASFLQLIIWICKQEERKKKKNLKDISSLTVLVHDYNC